MKRWIKETRRGYFGFVGRRLDFGYWEIDIHFGRRFLWIYSRSPWWLTTFTLMPPR